MVAPLPEHKNKWETKLLMDGYNGMVVTVITHHGYGCVITIVSKEEKTYLISNVYTLQCAYLDFAKMYSVAMGNRGQWVSCKHLYYVFRYFRKVDYITNMFNHATTFNYNKVMYFLEFVGMVKQV